METSELQNRRPALVLTPLWGNSPVLAPTDPLIEIKPQEIVRLSFNRRLYTDCQIENAVEAAASQSEGVEKDLLRYINVDLPLKSEWVIWEQLEAGEECLSAAKKSSKYISDFHAFSDRKFVEIASFSTLQQFWRYFSHIPQPSSLMPENKRLFREQTNFEPGEAIGPRIDALMIFKKGILPQWEDVHNLDGGHMQFVFQSDKFKVSEGSQAGDRKQLYASTFGLMDEVWNNLVMGLVGGTVRPYDFVTGIRLVDKLRSPSRVGGRVYGHLRVELWFNDWENDAKVEQLQASLVELIGQRLTPMNSNASDSDPVFPGYAKDVRCHRRRSRQEMWNGIMGKRTANFNNLPHSHEGETTRELREVGVHLSRLLKEDHSKNDGESRGGDSHELDDPWERIRKKQDKDTCRRNVGLDIGQQCPELKASKWTSADRWDASYLWHQYEDAVFEWREPMGGEGKGGRRRKKEKVKRVDACCLVDCREGTQSKADISPNTQWRKKERCSKFAGANGA